VTFINLYRDVYSLPNMCAALDISRSTYYKYRNSEDPDYYDYLIIKEVFEESRCTYGFRRIKEGIVLKYGVILNHKKIRRIMNKYGLIPKYHKKKNKNTHKRREENVRDNLLKRNFKAERKNEKWCTDITYLIFGDKRAYLSTIIDLYDRSVVAYRISRHNDNQLVINTLLEAIAKRKDVYGCILHSDQGFQYTSDEYRKICESKGILISMSGKGKPTDNSPIESWHALLKKEVLYSTTISSLADYIAKVEDWIKFYSIERLRNAKKKG